jgi:twinkle protein
MMFLCCSPAWVPILAALPAQDCFGARNAHICGARKRIAAYRSNRIQMVLFFAATIARSREVISMSALSQASAEFFEARGISPDLAARFEIYTAGRDAKGNIVASERGNVIAYPFVEHGVVVNEKYRGPEKKFWQTKGGRRTFWNSDALDDPALESGAQSLTITEGIEDALVAIGCGWPLTVSVPDGAPPEAKPGEPLPPLDPEAERHGKFEFLWNNRGRLQHIKRFIIAADDDPPGHRLAAELVRRLGAARCLFVSYPDGCKDLNDVQCAHGPDAVATALRSAKQYPVRGLFRLSEYPNLPTLPAISTGWDIFDGIYVDNGWLKIFPGEFLVVTGIPSHGKSTWVLNLLVNIARMQRWRSAIFSAEMPTVPYLRDKLRRIISGSAAPDIETDRFIEASFTFIDNDPNDDTDDLTLDWIIEKARDAVLRDGIRILFIDPWNEVEHARRRDEMVTEYVGRAIRQLKRFGRQYEVTVIVAAHPTKDVFERGKIRVPTLYDIEGSAHWFNKSDHGVVIERHVAGNESTVHIAKVRFDETGKTGAIKMKFDPASQRFMQLDAIQEVLL